MKNNRSTTQKKRVIKELKSVKELKKLSMKTFTGSNCSFKDGSVANSTYCAGDTSK